MKRALTSFLLFIVLISLSQSATLANCEELYTCSNGEIINICRTVTKTVESSCDENGLCTGGSGSTTCECESKPESLCVQGDSNLNYKYEEIIWDETEGSMDYPEGIELDSNGNKYIIAKTGKVPDAQNILVLDSENNKIKEIKAEKPYFFVIDNDDNYYIVDKPEDINGGRVQKFSFEGELLIEYANEEYEGFPGYPNLGFYPWGVAVDSNKNLYLTRSHNSVEELRKIYVFDEDGELKDTFHDDRWDTPSLIEIDSRGYIYLTDPGNDKVYVYDDDFDFITEIEMFRPYRGITIDDRDRLFVADTFNHRIMVYDENQNKIASFPSTGMEHPNGIDVFGEDVYVSGTTSQKVIKYTLKEDIEETQVKEIIENKTQKYKLSNGIIAEAKIMPEEASEIAVEKLGELNFTVELKGVRRDNNLTAVYQVKGEKEGRFLGLFRIKGEIISEIDTNTGEIISTKRPWWSFLASEI